MTDEHRKLRLRYLIATDYEGSQEKFGKQSERGKGRISQLVGESEPFGELAAKKLAKDLELPKHWFSSTWPTPKEAAALDCRMDAPYPANIKPDKEAPIKGETLNISALPDTKSNLDCENDDVTINQYKVGGSMGGGRLLLKDQPGLIKSWNVDRQWVQANVKHHTGLSNLCIVTGFGDSMLGMYNPGDPLLVDKGITNCDFDGVYFFRVGDEGFIKRLQRIPHQGIIVISENVKYRDWTITEDMDFHVLAKVLMVWESKQF